MYHPIERKTNFLRLVMCIHCGNWQKTMVSLHNHRRCVYCGKRFVVAYDKCNIKDNINN
ncbi:MAG: hypothetical protein AABY22_26590 [Nanoarchaeota archaeon]